VLVVIYKVVCREPLLKLEKFGAIIAVIGCVVAILDYSQSVKMPIEVMGNIRNFTYGSILDSTNTTTD
jgi:hypothetical protein